LFDAEDPDAQLVLTRSAELRGQPDVNSDDEEDMGYSIEEEERRAKARQEAFALQQEKAAEVERTAATQRKAQVNYHDGVQASELLDWATAISQFDAALRDREQLDTFMIDMLTNARSEAVAGFEEAELEPGIEVEAGFDVPEPEPEPEPEAGPEPGRGPQPQPPALALAAPANVSAFAPDEIQPDGKSFVMDISVFKEAQAALVVEAASARGKAELGSRKQLLLEDEAEVVITLKLPSDAFEVEEETDSFVWAGADSHAQYEVASLSAAELRKHACKAWIDVNGHRAAILRFELDVVGRRLPSPPVSPPFELHGSLSVLPAEQPPLRDGSSFHFFICHHQGSGGDQAHLVCMLLENLGYRVWHDNSQ
jgi:hypothetical protein